MTKSWFINATALMLLAGGAAFAADDMPAPQHDPMAHGDHMQGDWVPYDKLTLEQARAHAHKRAEKLDKMTQAEWDAHKKDVMERHDKWNAMTPEEKEKHKAEMRSKHHLDHGQATGAAPAADDKPVAK